MTTAALTALPSLVADGSFELQSGSTVSSPWTGTDGASIEYMQGFASHGLNNARIETTTGWQAVQQWISVKPFTHYTVEGTFQSTDNLTNGYFSVRGSSNFQVLNEAAFGATGGRKVLRFEFDSGSNPSVLLYAGFWGNGSDATLRVDDITMVEAPNLVANGSFENGGAGWQLVSAAVTTSAAHSGADGAQIAGTSGWNVAQQWVAVQANTAYHVSGWFNTSANAANGYFTVRGNTNFNVINEVPFGAVSGWQLLTFDFNSGSNTSVLLYAGYWAPGSSWVNVDDVTLTEGGDRNALAPRDAIHPRLSAHAMDLVIEKTEEGAPELDHGPLENRPLYLYFALTNNTPAARAGWVGGEVFPKHGSPTTESLGEWQVTRIGPGETVRGVARVTAPRADAGVSAIAYYIEDRTQAGEFITVDGPHIAESSPTSFDVAARYQISLDALYVGLRRSYNGISGTTDTDYAGLRVTANGNSVFDNSAAPKYVGDFGSGAHGIALNAPPFDLVPSDATSVDIAWTVMNSGGANQAPAATEKIMNGVSSAAAGVLGIVASGSSSSWSKVDDFVHWVNSVTYPNCDGPVAMDHITATSNVLEYKTFDDQSTFHDFRGIRYYDWDGKDRAYDSATGCGGSSRYAITWTVHRLASADEVEATWPMQGMVKPGGALQFSASDPGVRWAVDGQAIDVGWIEEQTGKYHAPAALPVGRLIVVRAETPDGAKHGEVFISLDER